MRKSFVGTVVAVVLVLAAPAWACPAPLDSGLITGTVVVGKSASGCANDGTSQVGGAGLGMPVLSGVKHLHWVISAPMGGGVSFVRPSPMSPMSFRLCGRLHDVAGIGAGCGIHSGDGRGQLTYADGSVTWIKFSWPSSVGGAIFVSGEATVDAGVSSQGKKPHRKSVFTMMMQLDSAWSDCAQKSSPGKSNVAGSTLATMMGAYTITP